MFIRETGGYPLNRLLTVAEVIRAQEKLPNLPTSPMQVNSAEGGTVIVKIYEVPRRSASWSWLRGAAGALALAAAGPASGASPPCLSDSIKEVPVGVSASGPHRVREVLTAAESAQSLDLVVSLRMRNFAAFQSIVQTGGTVSRAEMEARYLPLQADYDLVSAWLSARGLTLGMGDSRHTNIFVHGSVATIATVFGVSFARVATADGEFTSAVTAPLIPEEMSQIVLGVVGLQTHVRMRSLRAQAQPLGPQTAHPAWVTPGDVLSAYQAPAGLDGSGQTIGIFAVATALATDFTTFVQYSNSNAKSSNVTIVPISGGQASQDPLAFEEASLDIQWAAGIAPGANIRVYVVPNLYVTSIVAASARFSKRASTRYSPRVSGIRNRIYLLRFCKSPPRSSPKCPRPGSPSSPALAIPAPTA